MTKKNKLVPILSVIIILSLLVTVISAAPIVKSAASPDVSSDEAENIALEQAGLSRDVVRFERTERDLERGRLVWDVEFERENVEYSFKIDAKTGEILHSETEKGRKPAQAVTEQTPVTEPPTENEISREKAIGIALNDAGFSINDVRDLDVERDYERGVLVYEIDFEQGRNEYSYEIRISDGKVLTCSVDIDD